MKSWQNMVLENLLPRRFAIFRWLMTFLLVLSLTSCGEKAVSQDVSVSYKETQPPISQQFSEVSPPATIQELRRALEVYQPQVTIVTPQKDEVLQDRQVTVSFQVKDLPIFQNPEFELGPHLHVILDNEPYIAVYDLNQPLVLPDLSPGTHTLRVFASRPWDESFKNEGAYAQTTFHIFTKTDDNNPDPTLPLLTYSRPKGDYGAEPILLDFYLTNAPLHIAAENNPKDEISDWRIRTTINGESFVFDRWQSVYLKGFKPGKNWIKLEFLDNQGNPVKNVFNSTVRVINYQPNGKDTLSRIVRGELTADEVRGIVDPNYIVKIPPTEPTPEPTATPEVEKTPEPQIKEEKQQIPETEILEEPKRQTIEPKQPEEPKLEQPTVVPSPSVSPTPEPTAPTPEATQEKEVPQPPSVSPTPEIIETPAPEVITPSPVVTPAPEVIIPTPEVITPSPETTPAPEVITPTPVVTPAPEVITPTPVVTPAPEIIETPAPEVITPSPETTPAPEIIETPAPEVITPSPETTPAPKPTVKPEAEAMELPNV